MNYWFLYFYIKKLSETIDKFFTLQKQSYNGYRVKKTKTTEHFIIQLLLIADITVIV